MIKKNIFFFIALFIVSAGLLLFNLFRINKDDYEEYKKMKNLIWNTQMKKQNACQKRKKICKDIWIGEKESQRLVRIKSENSDIYITMNNEKIDLMENLYDIECLIENNTSDPMNKKNIYFFTASNGHYLFRSHNFLANNISIWFLKTPSLFSPYAAFNLEDAYLKGKANDLSFLLSDKKPILKVSSLKATVFPEREIK